MDFPKKCDFLYQSISDIQQTIRAIDVKIGFMFVVLLLPLPVLKIYTSAFRITNNQAQLYLSLPLQLLLHGFFPFSF